MPDAPAWILLVLMASGQAGELPTTREKCLAITQAVERGAEVFGHLPDGTSDRVVGAVCIPVQPASEVPAS